MPDANTYILPVPEGYTKDSSGDYQKTPSQSYDLPSPRQPYGFWHNVGAGVANNAIDVANLGLRGGEYIQRKITRGLNLSEAKGKNLSEEKGNNLSEEKGNNLSEEKGNNLSEEKGNNLSEAKGPKKDYQLKQLQHDPGIGYTVGEIAGSIPLFATGEGGAAEIGAGLSKAIPALEKIPSLAGKMLKTGTAGAGTTYVTSNAAQEKPGLNALMSFVPNSLLPVGGAIMSKALSIPKKYLIQSGKNIMGKIVKPLANHISGEFDKHLAGVNPEHLLQQSYEQAKNKAGDFSSVESQAQALDKEPGIVNNNFPKYQTELNNQMDMAQNKLQQGNRWKDLVNKISERQDTIPSSFEDAQAQAKEINDMGDFDKKVSNSVQGATRGLINPLHSALNEDVSDMVANSNNPKAQRFLDNWDMQRANYAKFKNFHNNPNADINNPSLSSPIEADLENKDYGKVLNKYIPSSNEGFNKIERLQNLTGNGDMANKAILSKFLDKYSIPGQQSYDIEKLANDIHSNKISPAVAALMPGHLKVGLGNIIKGQSIAQDLKDNPTLLHSATKHRFITGFLTALAARLAGAGNTTAGMAGVTGMVAPGVIESKLGKHYLEQAEHYVNEGDMSKLEEMLTKEQEPSKDVNVISPRVGKYIRRGVGASIATDPSLPLGGLASISTAGNNKGGSYRMGPVE